MAVLLRICGETGRVISSWHGPTCSVPSPSGLTMPKPTQTGAVRTCSMPESMISTEPSTRFQKLLNLSPIAELPTSTVPGRTSPVAKHRILR